MQTDKFIICLAVMAGTTYLIRLFPLLLVKKQIKSPFILSFLYYLPYAVLSAMTFPAVLYCTGNVYSAVAAVAVCVVMSYFNMSMISVALGGALTVAIAEMLLR